jgi:fatty-acyl-CoA synthase
VDAVRESTLGGALQAAAAVRPAAAALVGRTTTGDLGRWTFSDLLEDAERAARALLARFAPGERLAIWAPNVAECHLAQLACALAGLVAVPVPTGLTPAELEAILAGASAAGILLVPTYRGIDMAGSVAAVAPQLPLLREVLDLTGWDALVAGAAASGRLPDVEATDPLQIQFSSGTTGTPKGMVLHHRGVMNASRFLAERAGIEPGDRWLNFMPLSYLAGSAIAAPAALQAGCVQILCGFDPGSVLALADREAATVTLCGPTMARMLLEHPGVDRSLTELRSIALGGSPAPPALCRDLRSRLSATVWIIYGLTEACGIVTQTRPSDPDEAVLSTVGHPLPGVEVAIRGPDGSPLATGDEGEVCIRGDQVMHGYLDDAEATAGAIDPEGWLHTGDLGRLDSAGRLIISGRLKDIVNRGGRKLHPAEIERVLGAHAGVAAVAVAPLPDPRWGEIAAAFVVPRGDAAPSEADLAAWCRRHLAPYKTPERWLFVDELPLTRSGKVRKQVLVERYLNDVMTAGPVTGV